jgi:hypothetical protein
VAPLLTNLYGFMMCCIGIAAVRLRICIRIVFGIVTWAYS